MLRFEHILTSEHQSPLQAEASASCSRCTSTDESLTGLTLHGVSSVFYRTGKIWTPYYGEICEMSIFSIGGSQ
jgi:hypothetical protein